jgi:hypothetical protein
MRNYCSWCHQADEHSSLPGQPPVQGITKSPTCPQCHRSITLITIRRACEMVSKSKRTMYQWIEKGMVSTVRCSSGAPLICLTSLFAPTDEEFRDHLRDKREQAPKKAWGNDGGFVILTSPRAALLWEAYTESGEFRKAFGELVEDQAQNALSLMGWMAEDGYDSFYYAAQYAGIIAAYKMTGEPRFFVQTIDPKPLPKIEMTTKGVRKIAYQKAEVSAHGISVAGDSIYILTDAALDGSKRKVIDVYSKQDGTYLYSSELPEPSNRIYFTNDFVYTVNETTVTKWQWQ